MGRRRQTLTEDKIRHLKAGSGIHRDDRVGGLFLDVGKFKRSWKVQGTAYDVLRSDGDGGHEFADRVDMRHTLGQWPAMSLDEARKAAIDALALMKKGIHPARSSVGALYTVEDLYNQNDKRLERDGASEVNRRNIMGNATRHLKDWMPKPLAEITTDMVVERHNVIAFDDGHPEAARHLFKEFSAAWNIFRELNRKLPECPVPRRRLYAKRSMEGAEDKPLHGDEWSRFWQHATEHPDQLKGLSLKFNLLSGTRPVNTADLEWRWCDLDAARVNYPGSVMKNGARFVLPLSGAMLDVLRQARELWDGPLVFYRRPAAPGHKRWREQPTRQRQPETGEWVRTPRPLSGLVGHRLRHSHSNVCRALGIDQDMRNMLHAQRVEGIADVYTSRLFQFPQLLEAQERITAEILRRCGVAGGK